MEQRRACAARLLPPLSHAALPDLVVGTSPVEALDSPLV